MRAWGILQARAWGGDRVWVPAILETGTHKEAVRIVTPNLKSLEKTRTRGNFSYNAIR